MIKIPRNFIQIYRNKFNFHKYKKKVNKLINKIVHTFTDAYKGITNYRVNDIFWELVDEKIEYDPFNWYHVLANFLCKLMVFNILLEEKKIHKKIQEIHNTWAFYLGNRIILYEPKIPKEFFAKLISNFPVPNLEVILSLYEEGICLFEEDNLKSILSSKDIKTPKKILKFKQNFMNLFEIFVGKCEFIGNELSKYEGGKYGNDLYKIFQLRNNNKRSPPKLIEDIILTLVHIRNAISHSSKGGIVLVNNNKVRIRDYNKDGELKFDITTSIEMLWDYYYNILILISEFELLALLLAINRQIRELNEKYNKMVQCAVCGCKGIYFMHPMKNYIVCRKCKSRLSIVV